MTSLSQHVRYDHAFMVFPRGETGQRVIVNRSQELARARQAIMDQRANGPLGWLDLPLLKAAIPFVQKTIAQQKACSTLLVLGIGGSDIGARMLVQALANASDRSGKRIVFAGSNTDPDELERIVSSLPWKETCVNIVSKSGSTIESMAAFFVAREKLKKACGKAFASRVIATTDPVSGPLCTLARSEGYALLPIPASVGGRFSVLTSVGLFPAMWAGVSADRLLQGAECITKSFEEDPVEFQAAAQFAALHAEWHERYRHTQWICMPYSSRLELLGKWFGQLFAESLGKKKNRHGITVENGPTPIAALGASDQHSQLQLYLEGPHDKVVTFVEVEQFASRLAVPDLEVIPGLPPVLRQLSSRLFEQLIHAERQATAQALASANRPNGTFFLPRLDEESLGALLQTLMIAVAYLGELMDVNAYDQPGVEEGKQRFRALLGGPYAES